LVCPSIVLSLAFVLTGTGGRELRLLMERWKKSLSVAAAGAKSPATIVSRFGGLPQRQ